MATTQPSVRTTISGKDPGDVATLMQQLDAYSAQQSAMSEQLGGLLRDGAAIELNAAQAAREAGEANAGVAETTGAIEVAKQEQQQQILKEFGISVDDPRGIVQQRNQEIARARVAQENLRPVIEQKLNTGITDDPLQWIINQFELPGLKRQFNSERMRELTLIDQENTDRQRAVNQIAADAPNLIKETQLLAAQRAAGARAQAAFEAAKAEGKSQQLLAASIQEQMATDRMDFNTRMQLSLRLMDTISMTEGATKASEKFRKDVDPINAKRVALGLQPYTEAGWADLGPQARTQIREWAMLPGYGTGPGDTLLKVLELGGAAGFKQIAPMATQAIGSWRGSQEFEVLKKQKLAPTAGDPKYRQLPREQQDAIILDELASKWKQEVTPNSSGKYQIGNDKNAGFNQLSADNPYRLNSTFSLNAPELKDNLLNQFARDKFQADKNNPATDVQLLEHAKNLAVADPANIPKYAAATAEYFQKATKHQFKTRQLALLGFAPVDAYVVSGVDGDSDQPRMLQAVSPAQVERWMMSSVLAAEKRELMSLKTPAPFSFGF